MNSLLQKAFTVSAAVNPYRIVKLGSTDDEVVQAAAVTDLMFGVSNDLGVSAADITAGKTRIDIIVSGIADVKAGGTITRGNEVTSDASVQGVASAPAAGVNNRIIGIALASAVSGDIIPVMISQGLKQG